MSAALNACLMIHGVGIKPAPRQLGASPADKEADLTVRAPRGVPQLSPEGANIDAEDDEILVGVEAVGAVLRERPQERERRGVVECAISFHFLGCRIALVSFKAERGPCVEQRFDAPSMSLLASRLQDTNGCEFQKGVFCAVLHQTRSSAGILAWRPWASPPTEASS